MAVSAGYNWTVETTTNDFLAPLLTKSIVHSAANAADVNFTTLKSADAIEEFSKGTIDPGTCTFTATYDPTEHSAWYDLAVSNPCQVDTYRFTGADGSIIDWAGFICGFMPHIDDVDQAVMVDIEICFTGAPTVTLAV